MSENYLMLDGKRVDLTEEQIEKLGLKVEKDIFERVKYNENYYFIDSCGDVVSSKENAVYADFGRYASGNYCKDIKLMQQRAWHETLDRLLWRFSMQNDGDKIDWSKCNPKKYHIFYNNAFKTFDIDFNNTDKANVVYFYSEKIAKRAIDEIVIPFMKEHPYFVW